MAATSGSRRSTGTHPRTPRSDSAATRERLLASSLRLFSERGYEGTSVRAITDDAGVNLASANYHFGSKQQLLQATFQTALAPINEERISRLEALADAATPAELADLVRAFVEPVFLSANRQYLPKLLANVFAEPKAVRVPLLQSTFGPTVERFLLAIAAALPHVARADLEWRLHLVIGAMMQLAHFDKPLFADDTDKRQKRTVSGENAGIDQLISFAVAGLTQDLPQPTRQRKTRSKRS